MDAEGNSRNLVGDELKASNGFAHAIDGVLFPPNLFMLAESANAVNGSFEGVFDIFLAGVERLGLNTTLSALSGLYTVRTNERACVGYRRFAPFFPVLWTVI